MDPFTGGLICIGIFVHIVMLTAYTALPTSSTTALTATSDFGSTPSVTENTLTQHGEIKKIALNSNDHNGSVSEVITKAHTNFVEKISNHVNNEDTEIMGELNANYN